LIAAAREVHDGKGFVVLRGLKPSSYTAEDNLLLFLGISNYIGEKRGIQDRKGAVISSVISSLDVVIPLD